jgi:hypothetical protein
VNGKVESHLFNGTLKTNAGGHVYSYPFRASVIEQNMSKYYLIVMIWMESRGRRAKRGCNLDS